MFKCFPRSQKLADLFKAISRLKSNYTQGSKTGRKKETEFLPTTSFFSLKMSITPLFPTYCLSRDPFPENIVFSEIRLEGCLAKNLISASTTHWLIQYNNI